MCRLNSCRYFLLTCCNERLLAGNYSEVCFAGIANSKFTVSREWPARVLCNFKTQKHKKPGALQRMPPAQEPLPPLQPARPEVTSQRFYIQSFWSARVCKSYITEHPSTHALHVQISKVGASHDEHCPISPGNHSVLSSQAFTELIFAPRTQHSTKAMTIRVVICTIAPRKSLWALNESEGSNTVHVLLSILL